MSGKNKRPRRSISRPTGKIDSSLTDLSGKYYGQQIPIGKEQNDLFGKLLGLGSGLPGSLGSGSVGSHSGSGGSSGSRSNPFAMGTDLHGIYDKGSSYIDMLNGTYGNSELIQLLKSLGINYGAGLTKEQSSDWNKQLLDLILQQYANQEQRAYDRSVLDEQRLYDNPLNSLARLMGAGISRDAAIQILSGSGSGAGGSSGLIGSAANPISTGIPASQSELNGIQGKTAIVNTVFGGISAISGLVSLGFSVPQAIQQTKFLQNQNTLTQRQLSAYDSTGRAYSILNAAGASADAFGSVTSASAAIAELAKNGNADAIKFISSGGLASMQENASFSSRTLGELYHQERASKDYAASFDQYIRGQELENTLRTCDISIAGAEMEKIGSETRLNEQKIIESCTAVAVGEANIEYLNEQGEWIKIQGEELVRSNDAQISFIEAQTEGQHTQNKVLNMNYEYNATGFPMMKVTRMHQLEVELARWQCAVTPSSLKAMQKKWLQDPQNALDAAYLLQIHNNAVGSFATNYPNVYSLCTGFQASGVNDMLRTAPGAIGAGVNLFRALTPVP